jgi:predicted acetyltransferase
VVEIRTITEDEIGAYARAVVQGFHKLPQPGDDEFYRPAVDLDRTYAAFDGPDIVGTARSFATPLTLPGPCELTVAAVSSVTVRASHRRRGLLTGMMRRQLDEIAGRGESVAILIASEAPIYGRFGYGAATENVRLEVNAGHIRFTGSAPGGAVRFVDAEAFRAAAPTVYERFRSMQPGAIERKDRWWDVAAGITPRPGADPPGFLALHIDTTGDATGFVHYVVNEKWEGRAAASTIELRDLVAVTDDAYEALWRMVTGADWIARVTADDRPALEPLKTLIEDRRDVHEVDRSDFLWARLLDVPRALAARRYRVADRLTVEVIDPFRPASGGRFVLDAGPEGATCGPTSAPADLTLTASDLGAAYMGSTPLWPAAAAGRIETHRPGVVDAFDRLFGSARPSWCNTWF